MFGFKIKSINNTVWISGKSIQDNDFKSCIKEVNIIDRFPSQIRSEQFTDIKSLLPTSLLEIRFQQRFCVVTNSPVKEHWKTSSFDMPDVIEHPNDFESTLSDWGLGFIKPQFGALGRGVRAVTPTE